MIKYKLFLAGEKLFSLPCEVYAAVGVLNQKFLPILSSQANGKG
jgi:hypothetical protein